MAGNGILLPSGRLNRRKLIAGKHLQPDEALLQLATERQRQVRYRTQGSVYWNEFRRRWVMIAVERGGTSPLGEVWYAEADSPSVPGLTP